MRGDSASTTLPVLQTWTFKGLKQLVEGKAVVCDIPTLIRISGCLHVDPEVFLTRITRHVLLDPSERMHPELTDQHA